MQAADLQSGPAPSGHRGCLQPSATNSLFPLSWRWLPGLNNITASSAIPSTHQSVSLRLKEGKGQFTGSLRSSSWIQSLGIFAGGKYLPPEWREREGSVRKPLGRAPGGMCWPHWHCVRGAAQSEGPGAGGAEHLLLLHVSEIHKVSPACQSQLLDRLLPRSSNFKEAMKS